MRTKMILLMLAILTTALVALPMSAVCQEEQTENKETIADFIDLDLLRSNGDDWEVMYEQYADENGRIALYHNYWLMYFLHWRPLSEITDTLSAAYVEHHLLNFWGESMPFELTGTGGTTEVNGHEAYFVDGTIYDGRIKTRFIVWNCDQTGRQFTSDCNVNLSLGTNPNYLREQDDITHTICCHGTCGPHITDADNQLWELKAYNLTFVKPVKWRTNEFQAPTWFPDGHTATNGSLWTLPTDGEKRIDLLWRPKEDSLSSGLMREMIGELVVDTTTSEDTVGISSFELETGSVDPRKWSGAGKFYLRDSRGEEPFTDEYSFGAHLWNRGDRTYLLLFGNINMKELWGQPVDLQPHSGWQNLYYTFKLAPALRVDGRYGRYEHPTRRD